MQTWTKGQGADETCENCGAIYVVELTRWPGKSSGEFTCAECDHLIARWNSTYDKDFTLKQSGNKRKV